MGLLLAGSASATSIDIVYINDNITADIYFSNGSTEYQHEETNVFNDNFNTIMIAGTVDNSDDLLDNPTIIYGKVLYLLGVIFFAFMFLLVVFIIKKVIG